MVTIQAHTEDGHATIWLTAGPPADGAASGRLRSA